MKVRVKKYPKPILRHGLKNLLFNGWDQLWAYHPCVLEFKNRHYMFYTGKRVGRGVKHRIGVATSYDLKRWEKYKHNPVLIEGKDNEWDSDFAAHAYVFKDNNTFYMLYDGSPKGKWLEEIGLAQSSDLLHWTKYENNPIFKVGSKSWENHHVSRCCIYKEKEYYYLYYAGHDGKSERIGLAKGKSLFTLKRQSTKPVLDIGKEGEWDERSISDPKILKIKNIYFMLYSGMDNKKIERIGLATSHNLLTWEKYKGNPILDVSKDGWDKISAVRADFKIINNQIYIFYSGRKNLFYSIGMAKLDIDFDPQVSSRTRFGISKMLKPSQTR